MPNRVPLNSPGACPPTSLLDRVVSRISPPTRPTSPTSSYPAPPHERPPPLPPRRLPPTVPPKRPRNRYYSEGNGAHHATPMLSYQVVHVPTGRVGGPRHRRISEGYRDHRAIEICEDCSDGRKCFLLRSSRPCCGEMWWQTLVSFLLDLRDAIHGLGEASSLSLVPRYTCELDYWDPPVSYPLAHYFPDSDKQ